MLRLWQSAPLLPEFLYHRQITQVFYYECSTPYERAKTREEEEETVHGNYVRDML